MDAIVKEKKFTKPGKQTERRGAEELNQRLT
jgi:hypothetical protein